jgi:hypothetical protein
MDAFLPILWRVWGCGFKGQWRRARRSFTRFRAPPGFMHLRRQTLRAVFPLWPLRAEQRREHVPIFAM